MKKFAIFGVVAALVALAWNFRGGAGYLLGQEAYVYGFPLVMMDVTRQVMTAASTSGEYAAPINQFARIRTYVNPDFKNVVRISVNSIWTHGFVDLEQEPVIVTIPDAGGRYLVMQALNMWTDDFASAGTRTPETKSGNFLIAGPQVDRHRAPWHQGHVDVGVTFGVEFQTPRAIASLDSMAVYGGEAMNRSAEDRHMRPAEMNGTPL